MKIVFLVLFFPLFAQADIMDDFDSLGGNKVLLEAAQALKPEERIQIVQNRVVDRTLRSEIYGQIQHVASGGNPYFETNSGALNYQFHVNPRFSIGVNYSYSFNKLTPEGDLLIQRGEFEARANEGLTELERDDQPFIPELNWQKESYTLNIQWYPVYGKMGILNSGIVHFDVYGLLAAGKTSLRFNESDIYEAGLGMGIWWSQYLTSRVEAKYSTYEALYYDKTRSVENTVFTMSLGYLL